MAIYPKWKVKKSGAGLTIYFAAIPVKKPVFPSEFAYQILISKVLVRRRRRFTESLRRLSTAFSLAKTVFAYLNHTVCLPKCYSATTDNISLGRNGKNLHGFGTSLAVRCGGRKMDRIVLRLCVSLFCLDCC